MLSSIKQVQSYIRYSVFLPVVLVFGCAVNDDKEAVNNEAVNKAIDLQPGKQFATLPNICPTPDAFAIAPDGSLTLSCVNYANGKLQGELLSLSDDGQVSHLATVPTLKFKKKANPMGLAYDESGALYVADARGPKWGRILKLTFADKKIVNTEVIASGFNPNGLRYRDGAIYASQLKMPKVKSKFNTSGIYRFDINTRNLKVSNTLADKELIFHTETKNPDVTFGLDGLDFDSKGYFYTADLGDGEIYKLTLNPQGQVTQQELFAQVPNDVRPDGLVFDDQDNMYLAGFGLNQIYKVDVNRNVSKIADYPDNDGTNGQLDQPADLIVYNGKLIISNFDLMKGKGIRNTGHGKPYTLSYIKLN